MEKLFSERESLHNLIQSEWKKYKQAIADGKPFEETKAIYLNIKKLHAQIDEITEKIHEKLKIGD